MIDSAWTKYFDDETDGVIIDIKSDTLDLKSIADSGQCFRWYVQDDGSVAFLFEGCAVLGYTLKNGIVRLVAIEKSMTCNQIYEKVLNYLDFKTDYRAVINGIDKKDNHLINAAKYSEGIRILNAP
nr:8-oxoguanine DNA glycosylase, N-terminal domain-containing protein [Lachnospiraceae bacterium]